ncbi:MAG TPA: hypothetical protein VM915_04785 [Verrucomicrobiae bacterium]|jgi:hypothetical protein|nr:hypothetical protein [Verrucomicrobiae bacterium]
METKTTIDITPTWADLLPALLAVIESGKFEGRKMAEQELRSMAEAADKWNAHCREVKRLADPR